MGILTVLISTRRGVLMPNKSLPQVSGSQISFVIKIGKYLLPMSRSNWIRFIVNARWFLVLTRCGRRRVPSVLLVVLPQKFRWRWRMLLATVASDLELSTAWQHGLVHEKHFINTVLRQQYVFFFFAIL
jgi:hypothetical protein